MPLGHQEEDLQAEDFEVIKAGSELSAYTYQPAELNQLAWDICAKNGTFIDEIAAQRKDNRGYGIPGVKLSIFQQSERKIVLFSVVSDWGQPRLFRSLDDLDGAIAYYKNIKSEQQIDLREAVLLIPVAELGRNHYRLLVIAPDGISYYDSKSALVTNGIGVSVSASIAAYKATGDAVRAARSNQGAAAQAEEAAKDTVSARALRYVGTFAQKAPAYYAEYRHPVLETCKAYFPKLPSQEISLGNQGAFNLYDSGPIVVAYLELVVQGKPVVLTDVEHIRCQQKWPNEDAMFEVSKNTSTDRSSVSP